MQGRALAVLSVVVVLLVSPVWIFAADAQKPIGRVTASFGKTALEGTGKPRGGDLYAAVNNEDRVVTDGGGVSILLASRVVLKMDAESAIRISEQPGQTMIVLEHGTVHVYVGEPRPTADAIVTLADANSRIECKEGVFLASYSDKAKEGYYACEHGSVALTSTNDKKQVTLGADKQMVVKNHQSSDVVELDRVTFDQCKQYLERLDQISVSQGSDTFRMRSRTLDTQSAISQLAAAGWIDKAALAKNNQAAAAANTDENSTATSSDSTTNADGTTKKKTTKSNTGNTNALGVNSSNDTSTPKADPTPATPPAENVGSPDLASNTNTNSPPPVDLGKTGNGPKDKAEHGGKDGVPAAFTTPPVANTPAPVDINDVPKGGTPVVAAPPVLDTAPPVNAVDVPSVGGSVASVPPVDIEGPGKSNGKGKGMGGETVTLSAPPVVVAPPPVNITEVPNINTTPVVTPPPVDLTPAPAVAAVTPPPVDLSPSLPPVSAPSGADVSGKGGKGSGKGSTPIVEPTVVPPAVVPPVAVVTPPPVAVVPPAPIDLPKVEVPTLPPVTIAVPPPVNVSDVTSGTGASAVPAPTAAVPPPIDLPTNTVPAVVPPPTNVLPTVDASAGTGGSTPGTDGAVAPVPTPPVATQTPTDATTPPAPTTLIPTPTDVVSSGNNTPAVAPPTVVSADQSDKTTKKSKKKKGH